MFWSQFHQRARRNTIAWPRSLGSCRRPAHHGQRLAGPPTFAPLVMELPRHFKVRSFSFPIWGFWSSFSCCRASVTSAHASRWICWCSLFRSWRSGEVYESAEPMRRREPGHHAPIAIPTSPAGRLAERGPLALFRLSPMADIDREELKEQLRPMVAVWGDGIDLDTPFHWVVEDLEEPGPFFGHLPELLPPDSILYVEGTSIAPDVAAFYSSHRACNAVDVVRDTIAPVPDIYHFTFSPDICAALRHLAGKHAVAEMFDHIKAYREESLLFTFHDAFSGRLRLSEHLSEDVIARFCQALGVFRHREKIQRRDPEQLRRFLWALENPHKVRIAGEPWWKRPWRRWIGR